MGQRFLTVGLLAAALSLSIGIQPSNVAADGVIVSFRSPDAVHVGGVAPRLDREAAGD